MWLDLLPDNQRGLLEQSRLEGIGSQHVNMDLCLDQHTLCCGSFPHSDGPQDEGSPSRSYRPRSLANMASDSQYWGSCHTGASDVDQEHIHGDHRSTVSLLGHGQ